MERACASLRCGSSAAGPASSSRSPGPFWTRCVCLWGILRVRVLAPEPSDARD